MLLQKQRPKRAGRLAISIGLRTAAITRPRERRGRMRAASAIVGVLGCPTVKVSQQESHVTHRTSTICWRVIWNAVTGTETKTCDLLFDWSPDDANSTTAKTPRQHESNEGHSRVSEPSNGKRFVPRETC